jgi:hypothetical protein
MTTSVNKLGEEFLRPGSFSQGKRPSVVSKKDGEARIRISSIFDGNSTILSAMAKQAHQFNEDLAHEPLQFFKWIQVHKLPDREKMGAAKNLYNNLIDSNVSYLNLLRTSVIEGNEKIIEGFRKVLECPGTKGIIDQAIVHLTSQEDPDICCDLIAVINANLRESAPKVCMIAKVILDAQYRRAKTELKSTIFDRKVLFEIELAKVDPRNRIGRLKKAIDEQDSSLTKKMLGKVFSTLYENFRSLLNESGQLDDKKTEPGLRKALLRQARDVALTMNNPDCKRLYGDDLGFEDQTKSLGSLIRMLNRKVI